MRLLLLMLILFLRYSPCGVGSTVRVVVVPVYVGNVGYTLLLGLLRLLLLMLFLRCSPCGVGTNVAVAAGSPVSVRCMLLLSMLFLFLRCSQCGVIRASLRSLLVVVTTTLPVCIDHPSRHSFGPRFRPINTKSKHCKDARQQAQNLYSHGHRLLLPQMSGMKT